MVRFSLLVIVLIISHTFLEGQKVIGLRKVADTLYLDEINPDDCSARLLSRIYFPDDSLLYCRTFFYRSLSFEIDENFSYLFIGCSGKLFKIDFHTGKIVQLFYDFSDRQSGHELKFYGDKLIYISDTASVIDPHTLTRDTLFSTHWLGLRTPETLSTDYCRIFVTSIRGADEILIPKDIYNYSNMESWLQLWTVIDSIFYRISKNNLIDHVQDCYFFDLLFYNREEGLFSINVLNKEVNKLCDLPYQYIDMKSVGRPDERDCSPVIDLDVDGCEWADHIDRSDTIKCVNEVEHLLVNEARILSPDKLDSIVISLVASDDIIIEYHLGTYEGISIAQKDNDLYLYNDQEGNPYFSWILSQIMISSSSFDFTGKDLTFSFTPYLDGKSGVTSYLDIHYIEDVRKPVTYTISIPSGEDHQTTFYQNMEGTVTWWPEHYLSCTTCPDPIIQPWKDLDYIMEVESVNGCVSIDTLRVDAISRFAKIYVPNIINPTSSVAENRIFSIKGKDIAYYDLQVAHRNGTLIYDKTGLIPGNNEGWDGRFSGDIVPEGVYVYVLTAYPAHNMQEVIKKAGTVTVVR